MHTIVKSNSKSFVFCTHFKVYGPFFLGEQTANGIIYRDMLEL
jgi:hypothetical protein